MDLQDILASLGPEDMEKLQQTAAKLLGGEQPVLQTEKKESPLQGIDPKLLAGMTKFAGVMQEKDPRCDLLYALKPLLGEERRKKTDDAVNILRIFKLLQTAREGGIV